MEDNMLILGGKKCEPYICGMDIHCNSINPAKVRVLTVKGAQWKNEEPVFWDSSAADGYRVRYLANGGHGPIHSLAFHVSITGEWKRIPWARFGQTAYEASCKIIVENAEFNEIEVSCFPGKICVAEVC